MLTGDSQAFVVGASSTIGRVLFERSQGSYASAVGTYRHHPVPGGVEFDLEADSLRDPRFGLKPGAHVFLLAAATDPNWIFGHVEESERRFIAPLSRLAREADAAGARIVFFSSELVFDGANGGYREFDRPSPTTCYGRQKLRLEALIASLAARHLIVRTGALVTGHPDDNCVVRKTYETLTKPGARFAYDGYLSLTHVEDLVDITLRLLSRDACGVHHVAAAPLTRAGLAREVTRSSRFGHALRFDEVPFVEILYPEPRPRLSWLATGRLGRDEAALLRDARQIIPPRVRQLDAGYEERFMPSSPERQPNRDSR